MSHFTKIALCSMLVVFSNAAFAAPTVTMLDNKFADQATSSLTGLQIQAAIKQFIDVSAYREVKAQVMYNQHHEPDYVLVYLHSKKFHRVDIEKINLDSHLKPVSISKNYRMTQNDFAQQPGISEPQARCPDRSVQFIAFAPNYDDFEISITDDVAKAAESHHLKTVRLFKEKATRTNYLNYMSCPKLKGNFYDGDADPDVITTVDGVLSAEQISMQLNKQFKFKVTNIWLACQGFNDPLKTAMLETAQSQKYAAGVNNLLVGPSDKTAACTMKAALNGESMTTAFNTCYKQFDTNADIWGFDGHGSDYLGA